MELIHSDIRHHATHRNAERCSLYRKRARETDSVDKLICPHIAIHYGSDGLNSSCGAAQNKSNYLKILKV
jgi:hypothetical protein